MSTNTEDTVVYKHPNPMGSSMCLRDLTLMMESTYFWPITTVDHTMYNAIKMGHPRTSKEIQFPNLLIPIVSETPLPPSDWLAAFSCSIIPPSLSLA